MAPWVTELISKISLTDIIIAGIFAFGGGGAYTMKRMGWTVSRNGKKKSNPGNPAPLAKCPDPGCKSEVKQTAKDIAEIKKDFKEFKKNIYPTINDTAIAVGKIEGEITGWLKAQSMKTN